MTTLLIDPALSGDALRQCLYDGNLVVLTRLPAVGEFVEHARRKNSPSCSARMIQSTLMSTSTPSKDGQATRGVEAQLHTLRYLQEARLGEIIRQAGFPAEHTHYDVPKPPDVVSCGAPHDWRRLCLPVAPRCLVQRTRHSRSTGGFLSSLCGEDNSMGLRPAEFRPDGAEQLGHVRLLAKTTQAGLTTANRRNSRTARPGRAHWIIRPLTNSR